MKTDFLKSNNEREAMKFLVADNVWFLEVVSTLNTRDSTSPRFQTTTRGLKIRLPMCSSLFHQFRGGLIQNLDGPCFLMLITKQLSKRDFALMMFFVWKRYLEMLGNFVRWFSLIERYIAFSPELTKRI